ncbi:MAG: DUF4389 domain-containing protein [Alphaproteobacteria bacterium]|nr:DUF4389 domain-containing protein [Alphaproteobacteria bacterium]MBV9063705.1 DUF4389 domain-containing protein [Alphaproteobacteria bacterium]
MSDPATGAQTIPPREAHPPFPGVRLLYAFAYAILAWFVFWITLLLGLVQFIMLAINGRVNEELRHFCVNLVRYLWELLAYITFVRDEQPFPIGQFPRYPAG